MQTVDPDSYLGIDFGTSGARAMAISFRNADANDSACEIRATATVPFSATAPESALWQTALFDLIAQLPAAVRRHTRSIAINGTSSTVLLCNAQGNSVTAPLLYNDDRAVAVMDQVKSIAPPHHPVVSATSSFAKLLWWAEERREAEALYFLHQADWLAFLLHGKLGISDYHNALKLGYDVENLRYPDWLARLPIALRLPQVVAPGTPIAPILPQVAHRYGLAIDCQICAGTTDSIAAFLASGAQTSGEAVTSLGSTLVLKLLSDTRIDDAQFGIYSHRLDLGGQTRWLVGGASNTGGAVLKQFFSDAELQHLSQQIQPNSPSPLRYYPLLKPGERFPINDPHLPPQLEPRPDRPVEFLHGLLEGIARIEAQGYQLLQQLGATPLTHVYTAGGGAKNEAWTQIRSRHLQVPVVSSAQTEAAYGTALLARQPLR